MFNELIIREGSVRNTVGADGAVEGFSFETHIAYYRGIARAETESLIFCRKKTIRGPCTVRTGKTNPSPCSPEPHLRRCPATKELSMPYP